MEKPYGLTMRGIVKNDDGEILVLRRHPKSKTNPHKWELPGRKIEKCEYFDEALIREIKEELETVIKVEGYIDTIEYDYPTFHLSMDCFLCGIVEGDLVLKEHEASKWLTKEKIDSVDWLPADLTIIDKVKG